MNPGSAGEQRSADRSSSATRLGTEMADAPAGRLLRHMAGASSILAVFAGVWLLYLVFFSSAPRQASATYQLIYYVHLPSAVVSCLALGVVGGASAGYLWRKDDRLDAIGVSAAELGMLFASAVLVQGSIWARLAAGSWWVWDPRTTSMLVLWLIYAAYFVVRRSTENAEAGKRFAAIVGAIAAIDLPFVGTSVQWFHSQHPAPVALGPDTPWADAEVWLPIVVGSVAFALAFLALLLYRYGVESWRRRIDSARARAPA